MRLSRAFVEFYEWLPLLATPFVVYFLTDGFTHSLEPEIGLFVGLVVFLNIGWIACGRHTRSTTDFYKKYPGFRMKKNG